MAAATVRIAIYTGSSMPTTGAAAETGATFSWEDTLAGTTGAIPIPTSTGTAFSWYKNLALDVTSTGTTAITNRSVYQSTAPPTGLAIYWKSTTVAGYAQASSATRPITTTSGDAAAPTTGGWTAFTTSAAIYHAASVGTSSGVNGDLCEIVLGVSSTGTYSGGPGSTMPVTTIYFQYDESRTGQR